MPAARVRFGGNRSFAGHGGDIPSTATQTRTGHGAGATARSPALALLVICAGYFLVILDGNAR